MPALPSYAEVAVQQQRLQRSCLTWTRLLALGRSGLGSCVDGVRWGKAQQGEVAVVPG